MIPIEESIGERLKMKVKTCIDLKDSCIGCESLDLKTDVLLELDMGELDGTSHYELHLTCSRSDRCPDFIQCENFIPLEV